MPCSLIKALWSFIMENTKLVVTGEVFHWLQSFDDGNRSL